MPSPMYSTSTVSKSVEDDSQSQSLALSARSGDNDKDKDNQNQQIAEMLAMQRQMTELCAGLMKELQEERRHNNRDRPAQDG